MSTEFNQGDYKKYVEYLKYQVSQLKDDVDGKNTELILLQSELTDVTTYSRAISEITMLLLGMVGELIEHVQKNKWNDRTRASMNRLNRLLDLNKSIDKVSNDNYSLKTMNKEFFTQNQLLRIENKKLKQQIANAEAAVNF